MTRRPRRDGGLPPVVFVVVVGNEEDDAIATEIMTSRGCFTDVVDDPIFFAFFGVFTREEGLRLFTPWTTRGCCTTNGLKFSSLSFVPGPSIFCRFFTCDTPTPFYGHTLFPISVSQTLSLSSLARWGVLLWYNRTVQYGYRSGMEPDREIVMHGCQKKTWNSMSIQRVPPLDFYKTY